MTNSPAPSDSHISEKNYISEQLSLLAELSRDFSASLDISATLLHAVDRITKYLGAEGGALFLLQNEKMYQY